MGYVETDVSDTVTLESEDMMNSQAETNFTTAELCERGLLSRRFRQNLKKIEFLSLFRLSHL